MNTSTPIFIDLSHTFEDNMPGFKMSDEAGNVTQYTAKIRPFFTHEQSRAKYQGQSAFEVTEITFQSSVGTYLDSPFHRYPGGRDISQIRLEEVILPGLVIDARGWEAFEGVGVEVIPPGLKLAGKAVLFNFGWSKYWGMEQYQAYPFISRALIDFLLEARVKLVGVDTINVDNSQDLSRPAHSLFLKHDILIVENLTNLASLHDRSFRFFAVPIKGKRVAAMPVRAFAEVLRPPLG
jgi:kynurenine formamidase